MLASFLDEIVVFIQIGSGIYSRFETVTEVAPLE